MTNVRKRGIGEGCWLVLWSVPVGHSSLVILSSFVIRAWSLIPPTNAKNYKGAEMFPFATRPRGSFLMLYTFP
jgi:hypothetical protein